MFPKYQFQGGAIKIGAMTLERGTEPFLQHFPVQFPLQEENVTVSFLYRINTLSNTEMRKVIFLTAALSKAPANIANMV